MSPANVRSFAAYQPSDNNKFDWSGPGSVRTGTERYVFSLVFFPSLFFLLLYFFLAGMPIQSFRPIRAPPDQRFQY